MFSFSKNKAIPTAMAIFLITSIILADIGIQQVQAQLAAQQPVAGPLPTGVSVNFTASDTKAFLSFRPNPIGVGQLLLINFWINPALASNNRFLPKAFVITLTKPDGTKDTFTLDSEPATAAQWMEYSPDQAGEWSVKFEFLGCYFPAGRYYNGYIVTNSSGTLYGSCYYAPCSTEAQSLTVQQDYVWSWPPSPLPTDYWTRPVAAENREWWPILGSYPGTGYQGGGPMWDTLYPGTTTVWNARHNFIPWVQGPNSAHIVWKRQGSVAGLIGGPAGIYSTTGGPGDPDIVYAGRAYQTMTVPVNGVPTSCATCYDLRTGEMYYSIPGGVTPSLVAYYPPLGGASGTWSVELLSISGSYLRKVNPSTGALTGNYSIAPLSGGTFHNQRGGYVFNVQDLGAAAANATGGRYRLINWTTRGSGNLASRIVSNTSYLLSSLPQDQGFADDRGTNMGQPSWDVSPYGLHARYGANINIYRLSTGELLFNITTSSPDTLYNSGNSRIDYGKVAMWTQRGYFIAFDLYTGQLAWRSEVAAYPWASSGFGAYSISSGYGMIFYSTYDGVYAFNWTNGKILWNYKAPAFANFESPYITNGTEQYPFDGTVVVADGKCYTWNTEHTESFPLTRGWGVHCINATTGEGIWHISLPGTVGAIADGYATVANSRDGTMYVFGKGKSATTVTAPDVVVSKGSGVVIKGTVMDTSPAQPETPCVSKDSMTTQMEYLHKQMPIDGIWHNETITGVPVTLTAIDANGTVFDLGTATTNGYYGTFKKAWTPPNEGTYDIIATFAGDDSYGSSAAATAVTVGPAPEPITFPEQVTPPDYTLTIVYAAIAIIVAFAIGIALAVLILSRKGR